MARYCHQNIGHSRQRCVNMSHFFQSFLFDIHSSNRRHLFFHQVLSGNRLELHPKIPESIQVLIQLTMVDADHRPAFNSLRENLLGIKFEDGKKFA
jgi:hypothetical protein